MHYKRYPNSGNNSYDASGEILDVLQEQHRFEIRTSSVPRSAELISLRQARHGLHRAEVHEAALFARGRRHIGVLGGARGHELALVVPDAGGGHLVADRRVRVVVEVESRDRLRETQLNFYLLCFG